nr:MAG TPA: hypothetical protein [Caudoviricetes sp.]
MHRIQSTVSDAIVLYDSGYISDRRVSSDVPARTLTILGDFKAHGHSALHEVLVTQIRPDRTETPVRTQAEIVSRLNPFFFFFSFSSSTLQIIFAADSRSLENYC